MFYRLPPAGNPVQLNRTRQPERFLQAFFSPYEARFFASGTAALAAAITAAMRSKSTASPEVIVPAYACPDLISAALFAGAKPVLVDLEPERPWLDLERLQRAIGADTVAIIAASLLGIPERMDPLRAIAESAGVVLIEDSAQAFPRSDESAIWRGDLVVLSFGRGKPVSTLGGGAVLYQQAALGDKLPNAAVAASARKAGGLSFRIKARLYNRLISPRLYWLPDSLPFLHLGETRYHPLPGIAALDRMRLTLLPANISAYQNSSMGMQAALAAVLGEIGSTGAGLIDLPRLCQVSPQRRLLRYPLLVDAADRDQLYHRLRDRGAGVSRMYPAALTGISGLEAILREQGAFPAAEAFAARILTLATHTRVTHSDIAEIRRVLGY